MVTNNTTRTGFRLSDGPLTSQLQDEHGAELADPAGLSPAFGAPLLFAIARDPRTLFIYWNIDWPATFGPDEPKDRQVFMRVIEGDGVEESESLVEPMLGSFYAPVAKPRAEYHVEIGYYPRSGGWRSVALSDSVTMPPASVSENTVVDVATVPFHLSFQKMIDLFCESNGDPLAIMLSRIQERALAEDNPEVELHPEERHIIHAMNLTIRQLRDGREPFVPRPDDRVLRKRAEAILGFGSSSPAHGFGGSSPA